MKRDYLTMTDLTLAESKQVLELARTMKRDRAAHIDMFRGKAAGILMEKASTRTRVSFDVGAAQLGMHPVVLTTQGSQLARGEPVTDTARVLSRYVDILVYQTSTRDRLDQMTKNATVPVSHAGEKNRLRVSPQRLKGGVAVQELHQRNLARA